MLVFPLTIITDFDGHTLIDRGDHETIAKDLFPCAYALQIMNCGSVIMHNLAFIPSHIQVSNGTKIIILGDSETQAVKLARAITEEVSLKAYVLKVFALALSIDGIAAQSSLLAPRKVCNIG